MLWLWWYFDLPTKSLQQCLTHWTRVTHMCLSELTIFRSDNGLSSYRHQAIIWTKTGKLSIRPLGPNVNGIRTEIHTFSCKKMYLKMSSGTWRSFCLGLNVLSAMNIELNQGLYSLSGKTSCRQISWSLEAARLGVIMIVSLWNLTGIPAALLPRCLLNFRAIGKFQTRISRLRDFTRSCGKTSYRLVHWGPGSIFCWCTFSNALISMAMRHVLVAHFVKQDVCYSVVIKNYLLHNTKVNE